MADLFSTPLLVTAVLGVVGLTIPVIDAIKKEKGSGNRLYSAIAFRSEERRVGKECRSRWSPYH